MEPIELIQMAMERDLQHLSNVSHNISNINTAGFLAIESFEQVLQGDIATSQQVVITSKSPINETGRPLDFAIQGEGLFSVLLNDEVLLTRNGRFHIDQQGVIRHQSGAALLGENGVINVPDSHFTITSDGTVMYDSVAVDRVLLMKSKTVEPAKYGNTLFLRPSTATMDTTSKVKSSALNAANVSPGSMSIKMLELNRHLQSMQKAALTYDQMLKTGISEIGKRN